MLESSRRQREARVEDQAQGIRKEEEHEVLALAHKADTASGGCYGVDRARGIIVYSFLNRSRRAKRRDQSRSNPFLFLPTQASSLNSPHTCAALRCRFCSIQLSILRINLLVRNFFYTRSCEHKTSRSFRCSGSCRLDVNINLHLSCDTPLLARQFNPAARVMDAPSIPPRFPCWVKAVYSWGGEVR